MKNSLFDAACSAATLQRINMLKPAQIPRWGTMNATGMLQHCRVVTTAILSGKSAERKASIKERIMKTIVLRIMKRLPKGVAQPARIREATAKEPSLQFEEERERLLATVTDFLHHQQPVVASHPVFGPMNTAEWGSFAWVHLDHHLRQFGV